MILGAYETDIRCAAFGWTGQVHALRRDLHLTSGACPHISIVTQQMRVAGRLSLNHRPVEASKPGGTAKGISLADIAAREHGSPQFLLGHPARLKATPQQPRREHFRRPHGLLEACTLDSASVHDLGSRLIDPFELRVKFGTLRIDGTASKGAEQSEPEAQLTVGFTRQHNRLEGHDQVDE